MSGIPGSEDAGTVTVDAAITKAQLIAPQGDGVAPANTIEPEDEKHRITRAGAIAPRWNATSLVQRWEESTSLRPAVECMVANVDSHGHQLKKVLDPDAPDADEKIKTSILLERLRKFWSPRRARAGGMQMPSIEVTPADVEVRKAEIRVRMQLEEIWLTAFFSGCCPGSSFTKLRRKWRVDIESTGDCYGNLRRDVSGDMSIIDHLRPGQMLSRPIICDELGRPAWTEVDMVVRSAPALVEVKRVQRLFRTYVQLGLSGRDVYFKQHGDPRTISAEDGKMYAELPRGHRPATEVIHRNLYHPLYVHGAPRAIAAYPTISGVRDSQVVNAVHFSNNAIPRMAVLVHGGVLKDGADKEIERILVGQCQGIENYGSIIILQATPAPGTPVGTRTTIELKPLKEAVPDDALFQKYELQGSAVVLSQFRLPKILIGWAEDINRATADAALKFADEQVFQPERADFDEDMDMILLQEGIQCWHFSSNSALTRDPITSAEIGDKLRHFVSYNDGREFIASEIFNKPIPRVEEPWADKPLALVMAEARMMGGAQATAPGQKAMPVAKNLPELAALLEQARDNLELGAELAQRIEIAKANGRRELVIAVSGETMQTLAKDAA